jgi:hypothetical protein
MLMIGQLSLFFFVAVVFAPSVDAQENEKVAPVRIRAVLHDPIHPAASLFYPDKSGAILPLNFRPQDLTETMWMMPINGSLVLYDKAAIDPKNPSASLAASVKLPPEIKQAMVVVLPAPSGQKPAYRMWVIDDSEKAFPHGESRVLSLVGAEMMIQAGEHKVDVHPGKITRVPFVRKVNDFNMAQTNFYYNQGGSWVTFAERQLQYLEVCRRLFILHVTPGALQPTVTTIVDTNMGGGPR